MYELMNHPAFQGGVAPFFTGLIITFILYRMGSIQGISLLAGFLVTVSLTVGLSFDPLTSTRKIILFVMAAAVLSVLQPNLRGAGKGEGITLLFALGGISWILWPYLSRQPLADNWFIILSSLLFVSWITLGLNLLRHRSATSAGVTVASLALGLGITATVGASALYGQMAMAIGAAAMGYVLVQIVMKSGNQAGWLLVAVGSASIAMIGPASVVYAKVPWISLLALAFVPLLAQLEIARNQPLLKRAVILFIVFAVPVTASVVLALQAAGPVPF